jgi:RNA polymerase sigma factor (sigma-70 family)
MAQDSEQSGLEAVFLQNREALLRFLRAHGAGDAAEDLLQELWLRVRDSRPGPLANPLAYLYRAANNVMLDRHRSERQSAVRDRRWLDGTAPTLPDRSDAPAADRVLIGRETLARVSQALSALGTRVEHVFRRHRIEEVPQRTIAAELGVSLSTVESDLRQATRMLVALREEINQGSAPSTPSQKRHDD